MDLLDFVRGVLTIIGIGMVIPAVVIVVVVVIVTMIVGSNRRW